MLNRERRKYLSLLLGVACVVALLLCGATATMVRTGLFAPPAVNVRIGSFGIEAGPSRHHECPPHCEGQRPTSGRTYSVWFISTAADAGGERTRAHLLFARPLR
jgi:hypothetical protein